MTVIASLGCDLPLELLDASGGYIGPLPFDADRPTPTASRWLESKFAPWTFQILEDWATGALDHVDLVLFSRGDDSCQRLYYYVCELQRLGEIAGPTPLIFDLCLIRRQSSLARTISSARKLADRLGVTEAALSDVLAKASLAPQSPGRMARPTCLLAGTLPPDERIHAMIQRCGWDAVGTTLPQSWAARGPVPAIEDGDAFARMGQILHHRANGPRAFRNRAHAIVEQARACGADAVLLWFCEHDEAEVWHAPAMQAALAAAGIRHAVLTRRDWTGADGIERDIAAFLEGTSL